MNGSVTAKLTGDVGKLTFSSPKANSMDSGMLREFVAKIEELGRNPDCRVIVVESPGKTFCAGASLEEIKGLKGGAERVEFFTLFGRATVALRNVGQPVIVRVQGKTVGGGVGLVAAADYAIGTPLSAAKLSEFLIGIGPFAISPVLQWKIGNSKTLALALSADFHSAEYCLGIGLLDEVVEESKLDERVAALAIQIAAYFPQATARFKRLCNTPELDREVETRAKIYGEIAFNHSDPAA